MTIKKALGLVLLIVGTFIFVNIAPLFFAIIFYPQIVLAYSLLIRNVHLYIVGGLIISLAIIFLGGFLLFSAPSRN